MNNLSKSQIQSCLTVLVCCCIKWEKPEDKVYTVISWDDQKLYRLETIYALKGNAIDLIQSIQHTISFEKNWKYNDILNAAASQISEDNKEQILHSVLQIISSASFHSDLQYKSDVEVINEIRDQLKLSPEKEKVILNISTSFGRFVQAIDKQFNLDYAK